MLTGTSNGQQAFGDDFAPENLVISNAVEFPVRLTESRQSRQITEAQNLQQDLSRKF